MENLLRKAQEGFFKGHEFELVICDNPEAKALDKAKNFRIPTTLVDRKKFKSKSEFEAAIIRQLEVHQIDWIVLAGFMRILSAEFVQRYHNRIINVHPSLLPDFPGGHSIKDAFEAKVKETGVTIHFVDAGVDSGPIIDQRKVAIDPSDTLETLEAKIHKVEYDLYPKALKKILDGEIKLPKHDPNTWTED